MRSVRGGFEPESWVADSDWSAAAEISLSGSEGSPLQSERSICFRRCEASSSSKSGEGYGLSMEHTGHPRDRILRSRIASCDAT